MVSNSPQPGRCGAKCINRVGIEIYPARGDEPWTEEEIDRMWMVDPQDAEEGDPLPVEVEPEYQEAREYRWDDWVVFEALLTDGSKMQFRPEDEDWPPYMKWSHTEVRGYCEKFPSKSNEEGRCYIHGKGDNVEGNTNAMTHGLYAQEGNYYKSLSNKDKAWIDGMVDSWIENCPFDRDNEAKVNKLFQVAVDEHKMWRANDYFAEGENDLVTTEPQFDADNNYVGDEEVESPMNLVYDRMARTNMNMLKELGALDDPESQQANATRSLAQQLSGMDTGE